MASVSVVLALHFIYSTVVQVDKCDWAKLGLNKLGLTEPICCAAIGDPRKAEQHC